MSGDSLSEAVGIDRAAEEALARAGVHSVKDLADAEPDSLAMASGIPIDRIREWQQRARRVGPRSRGNPIVAGWTIAVAGLLVAALVGWVMMAIGAARVHRAEQVRTAAESRLQVALDFAATQAIDAVRAARLALARENWGNAQSELSRADQLVTLMERIAPDGKRAAVSDIRERLEKLQQAVGNRSRDVTDQLDRFEAALDDLRQQEPTS